MKRMTMGMLLHISKVLECQVDRLIRDAQVQFFELQSRLCHGCLIPHSRCSIRKIGRKTGRKRGDVWIFLEGVERTKSRRIVIFNLADCSGQGKWY